MRVVVVLLVFGGNIMCDMLVILFRSVLVMVGF